MMAVSLAMIMIIWALIQTTIVGMMADYSTNGGIKVDSGHRSYRSVENYNVSTLPTPSNAEQAALFFSQINKLALNASINYALSIRNRMARFEANLVSADIGLPQNTPSHNQYLFSRPSTDAIDLQANADIVSKASLYLVQHHCQRYGLSNEKCAQIVSKLSLNGTIFGNLCSTRNHTKCLNKNNRYRTIDGSCNNIIHPRWGSALTPYSRISFPNYYDGIQEPRHAIKGRNLLPGPRTISIAFSEIFGNNVADNFVSQATLQWAEFISHDLAHTVVRKMAATNKPIRCCELDGSNLLPRYVHPDCAAISVPDNDPIYSKHNVKCINYVRSLATIKTDCSFGPIEQMNQVTHFLDASTIYGSSKQRSQELRTFDGGKLKVDELNVAIDDANEYLPLSSKQNHSSEVCPTGANNCYKSGDDRVNIGPSSAVFYTIWHREHNRIADELAKLNPLWSDQTIYEEARRTVIAEIQHITYNEWLPTIVGENSAFFGDKGYKAHEDPSVNNEAVTTVFEYMNYINELTEKKLIGEDVDNFGNYLGHVSRYFYEPRVIEIGDTFDTLLRGLSSQLDIMKNVNANSHIMELLNSTSGRRISKNNVGLDVLSLDIQRGRDHGFSSYNYYREYCGLSNAKSFDDFLDVIPAEIVEKMKTIYNNPNDVDLIVGGMSELPVHYQGDNDNNSTFLGPTFKCLLLEQLAKTKRTDRFFYDSKSQPYAFTNEQLNEIRKVTLARIFCDNGNNISHMQPYVFLDISRAGNNLESCENYNAIPRINLLAWTETKKVFA